MLEVIGYFNEFPRSYLKIRIQSISFRCIRCHLHKIIRHRGNSIGDILKYLKIGIVHIHIFIELCNPKNEQMKILYIISSPHKNKIPFEYRNASYIVFWNTEWRKKNIGFMYQTKAGEKGKAYPVLYLLDGDSFFHSVVGFTRFFSSSKTSNLPPCIVVAVLNTDRPEISPYLLSRPPGWYHLSLW